MSAPIHAPHMRRFTRWRAAVVSGLQLAVHHRQARSSMVVARLLVALIDHCSRSCALLCLIGRSRRSGWFSSSRCCWR